jgi:hypothetical protein
LPQVVHPPSRVIKIRVKIKLKIRVKFKVKLRVTDRDKILGKNKVKKSG